MSRILLLVLFLVSCDSRNLTVIAELPLELNEVSGMEVDKKTGLFWMINDSGNKPILYGVDKNGKIIKKINIKSKNRDWEDLTSDEYGNLYIGDFGNNDNDSKNLVILKIYKDSLNSDQKSITPERISFTYPEQINFPPKKSKRHFDCESLFFYRDSLYLFTKSRSNEYYGKTNLYQLPSVKGAYKARLISTFNSCEDDGCRVTSATINESRNKMVLLTENSAFVFTEFTTTNFFNAKVERFLFNHNSQKESVAFKNDSILYVADEYLGIHGGNIYEFDLN